MGINAAAYSWPTSLGWSAVFRAVGMSVVGFLGWLWFFSADDPAWKGVSLVAVLALGAFAGVAWYLPRARAHRRWQAALDRYAEQARSGGTPSWRNSPARPPSPARWAAGGFRHAGPGPGAA